MNAERRPHPFVWAASRIRALATRRRAEAELDEEVRFHVDMEIRANIERGMAPAEARRAALRDFGGVTQTTEAVLEVRSVPFVEHLMADVRGALRRVRREPGFAAAVVSTIGLAVGLATTIYAAAAGVLLRPLPFERPSELVQVWKTMPGLDRVPASVPEFLEWRSESRSFAALGAAGFAGFHVVTTGGSEWSEGAAVSSNLFPLLGVKPLLGRLFRSDEDQASGARVVALDEGFWRRAFGGDPNVLGRQIRVATDDRRFRGTHSLEIVGIVPASVRLRYAGPRHFDLYVPLTPNSRDREPAARNAAALWVFGRLRAGVSAAQARTEVEGIFMTRSWQFVRQVPHAAVKVSNLHDDLLGQTRPAFLLLSGAMLVVLLIAGTNLMNLLLASGVRRSQELATRLALGCSRTRLVQQLVTEVTVLAVGGGVLGVCLALAATPIIKRLAPATLPRIEQVQVDASATCVALALATASGLLFGLLSAFVGSRPRLLGLVPGRALPDGRRMRLRSALVVAEATLVVVLLGAAGLVVNSFWRLSRVDLGFDPRNVLAVETVAPDDYWTSHLGAHAEMLTRLRAGRGIVEASWSTDLPFPERSVWSYRLEDGSEHYAAVAAATAGFLPSLRVPLLEGRQLTDADDNPPRHAVVSRNLARGLFPPGHAVGQRLRLFDKEWYDIVGVVGDITEIATVGDGRSREKGLDRATIPRIYVPSTALLNIWPYLVVRTKGDPGSALATVLADLRAVVPEVSVRGASLLDQRVADAGIETRFYALILSAFAGVSFVLAAVGLFGVLAYDVARRSREFGIRLALGASPTAVRLLVVRQALTLAGSGAASGLLLAVAGGRAIRAFLFEVSPSDPWTLTTSVAVLTLGGLVAAYLPARRASGVDPTAALRCE
jgi:putative ABC transport system permease protein